MFFVTEMYARLESDGGLLKVNVNDNQSVIKKKKKASARFYCDTFGNLY